MAASSDGCPSELVHRSPSGSSRVVPLGPLPPAVVAASPPDRCRASGVVTAVVAPQTFRTLPVPVPVLPLAPLLVSSALLPAGRQACLCRARQTGRSFRLSPALFATMALADSPSPLRAGVSPGKAPGLSPRAAGLYPPRFFDSLRTSPSLAGSPACAGHGRQVSRGRPRCPFVFLRSRFCLPLPSASPLGYALRFGYGCRYQPR